MPDYLSTEHKREIQSRYRRYETHYHAAQDANEALKRAKSSRIWMVGVAVGVFSFQSEFLLGAAFAFLGTYFYQVISAQVEKAQAEDAMEELARWFGSKGLMFQDKTPFFRDDDQLENPLDLFQEAVYR